VRVRPRVRHSFKDTWYASTNTWYRRKLLAHIGRFPLFFPSREEEILREKTHFRKLAEARASGGRRLPKFQERLGKFCIRDHVHHRDRMRPVPPTSISEIFKRRLRTTSSAPQEGKLAAPGPSAAILPLAESDGRRPWLELN